MKHKKEKDFWIKKTERFTDGAEAKTRASILRNNVNVTHVMVDKEGEEYIVSYSVAKWYLEAVNKIGVKL